MSQVMILDGDTDPKMGRGFGLLPGTVIDQHFLVRNRQERLMGALAANPGMVGLGIDEGAAVVVRGRRLRVVGDADVVACISPSIGREAKVRTLRPGAQADLMVPVIKGTSGVVVMTGKDARAVDFGGCG
jgi:cyanophycinase-like exopeptidase